MAGELESHRTCVERLVEAMAEEPDVNRLCALARAVSSLHNSVDSDAISQAGSRLLEVMCEEADSVNLVGLASSLASLPQGIKAADLAEAGTQIVTAMKEESNGYRLDALSDAAQQLGQRMEEAEAHAFGRHLVSVIEVEQVDFSQSCLVGALTSLGDRINPDDVAATVRRLAPTLMAEGSGAAIAEQLASLIARVAPDDACELGRLLVDKIVGTDDLSLLELAACLKELVTHLDAADVARAGKRLVTAIEADDDAESLATLAQYLEPLVAAIDADDAAKAARRLVVAIEAATLKRALGSFLDGIEVDDESDADETARALLTTATAFKKKEHDLVKILLALIEQVGPSDRHELREQLVQAIEDERNTEQVPALTQVLETQIEEADSSIAIHDRTHFFCSMVI